MERTQYTVASSSLVAYRDSSLLPSFLPSSNSVPGYDSQLAQSAEDAMQQQFDELSALFSVFETMTGSASKANDAGQKFDNLVIKFMNNANTVLGALADLGSVHPAVGIVLSAIHKVVEQDIKRRENEKKVLIVVVHMQNMLGPMLRLKQLDDKHLKKSFESELSKKADQILADIEKCRGDLAHFMGRKTIYKFVLATGYEKKFADHITTFTQRRTELQQLMTEYTTYSIEYTVKKVDVMDVKMDTIIGLLKGLRTPQERNALDFIDQNGGAEKCVNDQTLLPKLLAKAGETSNTGKVVISDRAELDELQKSLNKALKENLDEVLEKHYARFKKVLQVQNDNLKRMSEELEEHGVQMNTQTIILQEIRESLGKTKAVKLKDEEIDSVWSQMNLGNTSVKAKVFVLTFRDHIRTEHSTTATPTQRPVSLPQIDGESSTLQPNASKGTKKSDSQWALKYIDAAYVRPIVEALDDDGSGFISVKEANDFAVSRDRPKSMTLLDWMAYWAAGWHVNLVKYQRDIHSILLQMRQAFQIHQVPPLNQTPPVYQKLPSVHIANRTLVNDFLDQDVMRRVEALCRSLTPLSDTHRTDPRLLDVADRVASRKSRRLESNLKVLGFVIDSPSDVVTISESARVETWIFPLLYLLLRRYLEIVNVAKTIVLDPGEFEAHVTSLKSVFAVFDERMESLEAKFRQLHKNVDDHFLTFAYGMFYAAHKKNEFDTSLNTLLTGNIDEYIAGINVPEKGVVPDASILSKPVGKVLDFSELDLLPSSLPPIEHIAHPIEGNWFGWADWNGKNHKRPHRCVIHPIVDNNLIGKGETFFGAIDFVGAIIPDPESEKIKVKFEFIPAQSDWRGQLCEGFYDPVRDVIEGTFKWREEPNVDRKVVKKGAKVPQIANGNQTKIESEIQGATPVKESVTSEAQTSDDELHRPSSPVTSDEVESTQPESAKKPDGRFYLTRNTPYAFRFRTLLDGPGHDPEWSGWPLWRKRWAFAIEAVLYETRFRIGSKKAVEEALAERRRWLYYTIREDITNPDIVPQASDFASLTETEWDPWYDMATTVQPNIARIWEETGHYMAQRQTYVVGRLVCDSCNKLIAFCRYQCVVCMKDDLSSSIELCENCFDKAEGILRGVSDFEHLPSHSLLRSRNWVHSYEANSLIPAAQLTSEECKRMFRELEDAKKAVRHKREIADGKTSRGAEVDKPAICGCCNEEVSLPCWACVDCSPRTFICISCDRRNASVNQDEHSVLIHHLLLIRNSDEVKSVKVGKGSNMKNHFDKINANISTLYEKVKLMAETIGVDLDLGITPVLASMETSPETHDKKAENADSKAVELIIVNGKPLVVENGNTENNTDGDRVPQSLRDRLAALEANVKNINQMLPILLEKKLEALDEKMDRQFGALLAVVQNFVGNSERALSMPNDAVVFV